MRFHAMRFDHRHAICAAAICAVFLSTQASAVPAAGSRAQLLPLPRPDLSAMEAPVQQKVRDAQAKVEALLERQDTDAEVLADAYGFLGQLLHAYRLFDGASTCYANAASLVPDDFRWPFYLALAQHAKGELEPAVANYAKVLERRPNDLAALLYQGQALLALNRAPEAATRFEQALTLDNQSAAAMFGLGKAKATAGDHARAVELFEQALALQPAASEIHYPLAQSYRRLNELEKAREHLQLRGDVEVHFPDPLGQQIIRLAKSTAMEIVLELAREKQGAEFSEEEFLGFALGQFGDVKGTIEQLRQGLALQASAGAAAASATEQARINYVLGGLLVNDGRDEEAIHNLETAIRLDPSLQDARIKLGNALARTGRFEDAVARYGEVLSKNPRNSSALLRRAAARMSLGQDGEAISDLEMLVAVDPKLVEAQVRLATSLARQGQKAEAEEHFRRALTLEPGEMAALSGLATLLAESGRMLDAAELYGRWAERDPKNPRPRLAQATALILSGQYTAARDQLEALLAAFPDNLQAQDVLARHLAACPDPAVRNGRRALELARVVYDRLPTPQSLETLAMAHAQAGDYAEATRWQKKLIDEHGSKAQAGYLERLRANLALYEGGKPCCVGE